MMIVVMKSGAAVSEVSRVIREIEQLGLQPRPSHGVDHTIIGVIGAHRDTPLEGVAQLPGVAQVTPVTKAFKLVNREFKPEPTVVNVNGVAIGGREFVVMAGPCAVESHDQILATARAVRSGS